MMSPKSWRFITDEAVEISLGDTSIHLSDGWFCGTPTNHPYPECNGRVTMCDHYQHTRDTGMASTHHINSDRQLWWSGHLLTRFHYIDCLGRSLVGLTQQILLYTVTVRHICPWSSVWSWNQLDSHSVDNWDHRDRHWDHSLDRVCIWPSKLLSHWSLQWDRRYHGWFLQLCRLSQCPGRNL